MGKMISLLLMVFAIEMALFIFTGSGNSQSNSLFALIFNPPFQGATTSSLDFTTGNVGSNVLLTQIYVLVAAFVAVGAVSIISGSAFKPDSVLFATFSAVLAAMCFLSIVKLWTAIYSYAGGTLDPQTGGIIASLITAPIFIVWFITAVDFIRRPD